MNSESANELTSSTSVVKADKHNLPGIKTLISDTWQLFKAVGSKILLFELSVGFAIAITAVILTILGVLVWTTTQPLNLLSTPNPVSIVGTILELILVGGGVTALIYLVGVDIVGSILIPAQYPEKSSFKQLFTSGFKMAIPVFLAMVLVGLITWGGIFIFVIPGILFYILLIFYNYEIILNHQGVLDSLRRSYLIASHNFWPIVLRFIVLGALSWVVSFPFSLLNNFTHSFIITILDSLVRIAFALYSVCYSVVLYRQVSQGFSGEKGKKIGRIIIVAVIGWVLMIVVTYLLIWIVGPNVSKAISGSGLDGLPTQLQGQENSYPLPSGYQHLQDTAVTPGPK